ncbi:hypothetical protein PoB_003338000 [Plakobranchus ocellatus]|uniref:Uncharacterized protein n=1 Tax=Plakobranchus ocellatus TaxID=259542 RepID=A0AAV4AHQ7_9GAST|nr:hypothetical protein PoB_003338000 [Plakobranchus ocellatus]
MEKSLHISERACKPVCHHKKRLNRILFIKDPHHSFGFRFNGADQSASHRQIKSMRLILLPDSQNLYLVPRYNEGCYPRCSIRGFIKGNLEVNIIGLDGTRFAVRELALKHLPPTENYNGFRAYWKEVLWYQTDPYVWYFEDYKNISRFECSITDEGTGETFTKIIRFLGYN